MDDFKVGDEAYYLNDQVIGMRRITGVDIVDGYPKYWLDGCFGYFNKHSLFRTEQDARERLNRDTASGEMFTIHEAEKLAYKVWYAQFEREARILLEGHKKSMDAEYSMVKKYKSEIYRMFEALKSTQKEINDKVRGCEYAQREIFNKLKDIKDIHKKIQHTERKLSYALGEPYDKRNLKRERQDEVNTLIEKLSEGLDDE